MIGKMFRSREIGSKDAANASQMTFLEHLGELRTRLLYASYGVIAGSCITLYWADELFLGLQGPFRAHFEGASLIGTGPAEAFVTKLKLALVVGFMLSLPWVFTQLWLFILPGLHENERKFALPFIGSATLSFLIGAGFCYGVALPFAFEFFADSFRSVGLDAQIRVTEYLSFLIGMVFVFGIMFEMPLLAYVLARLRVLPSSLLMKNFRYAIVAIFIIAGILTPPDVVTQFLLAVPLIALYGLSIVVAQMAEKTVARRTNGDTR